MLFILHEHSKFFLRQYYFPVILNQPHANGFPIVKSIALAGFLYQGIGGVALRFADFGIADGTTIYEYSILANDFNSTLGSDVIDYIIQFAFTVPLPFLSYKDE